MAHPITIKDLFILVNNWIGTGTAEFPTHPTFQYREELNITKEFKHQLVHYDQKAWIISHEHRHNELVSWETGFIIDKGNSLFELICTHNSGRIEQMRGLAEREENGAIKLSLHSTAIINDDKVIQSRRQFLFTEKSIEYTHFMGTIKHPAVSKHLSAHLRIVNS